MPLSPSRKNLDGRWVVLAMVAVYLLSLIAMPGLLGRPYYEALRLWGVNAFEIPFVDLAGLPIAADILHAGGDPTVLRPTDPYLHRYNYPQWWLYCESFGLNQKTVVPFGLGICLLTFGCALHTLGRIDGIEGAMAGSFLISPAVVLGFERGNIDLLIFCLLTLALSLRRIAPAVTLTLTLATILKLFPVFSLLALISPLRRKKLLWLAGTLFFLLIYFITDLKELSAISRLTPKCSMLSYGSLTTVVWLYHLPSELDPGQLFRMLFAGAAVISALSLLVIWNGPRLAAPLASAERELFAFRMGAGIYVGTFALGTNFDYRTLFLIFCFPLLFLLRQETGSIKTWAWLALASALLYVTWDLFSDEHTALHVLVKQLLSWNLLASLVGILAATFLPPRKPKEA